MKTSHCSKNTKIAFVVVVLVTSSVFTSVGSAEVDTWTQKADMPTPRWNHSAAVVNDKIYVIGGIASEPSFLGGEELSAVEQYNPATDTWTRKADMPAPRGYLTKSNPVVDGKIYVIGGGKSASVRVDIYDPVMDTWSRGADMPTARLLQATAAWDGKIYAFGGWLNSGQRPYSDTWEYDQTTDTWTEAAPLPDFRAGLTTSAANGKIYAIGGTPKQHNCRATSTVYELSVEPPPNPGPTAVLEHHQDTAPDDFTLDQNYPNPFNSGTVIRFALPQSQEVELTVYNLAGQKVVTLIDGHRPADTYAVAWDGRDAQGNPLASGLYLYKLKADVQVQTRKLMLLH